MKTLFISSCLITFALFSACSKEENPTTPSGTQVPADAPKFITNKVIIPEKMPQSSDTHAQTVVFYASMANALSSTLGSYFTPPSLNKMGVMDGDGPWEYSWKEGELTVTVKITLVVDQYVWEAYYSGKINDIPVNNFLAVKAQQALNERSGNFESYQPPLSTVQATYSWSLDSLESLLFQVIAPSFQQGGKFVGKSNVDQSGELEVYKLQGSDYVINEKFKWTPQGAGEWWEYADGVVSSSGAWD